MNKYFIINKKKIFLYLYLLWAFWTAGNVLSMLYTYENATFGVVFAAFIIFILFVIITTNFINYYEINERKVAKGIILRKKILWDNSNTIEIRDKYITIRSNNTTDKIISIQKWHSSYCEYERLKDKLLEVAKDNSIEVEKVDR